MANRKRDYAPCVAVATVGMGRLYLASLAPPHRLTRATEQVPILRAIGISSCAPASRGLSAALARQVGADVVAGFSMGGSVALEMVASGEFAGPAVLLGIRLSAADEPGFFRALVRGR